MQWKREATYWNEIEKINIYGVIRWFRLKVGGIGSTILEQSFYSSERGVQG